MENKSEEKLDIPDGKYNGKQSAYFVTIYFEDGSISEPFLVTHGIRGINWSCGVEIIDGIATIHDTMFDLPKPEFYYIQYGYADNVAYWWKHNNQGYSCNLAEAKRFTEKEMKQVIHSPNQHKYKAWKCSYIDRNKKAVITAVDTQYLDGDQSLS